MNNLGGFAVRYWKGVPALAIALGSAVAGPVCAADAVSASAVAYVPTAVAAADPVDPEAVAEAVSEALDAAADEPIAVKPSETAAPVGEAAILSEHQGVAELDAAPVGEAEVSLDQAGGEVTVLVTDALATPEFSVAGVTWEGDEEPGRVLARAYQNDEWTEWFDLEAVDGPDPDSAEGRRARAGSEPLVVAGATAIQIQVLSEPDADLPAGLVPAVVPLSADEQDPDPAAAGQTDAAKNAASPGTSVPGGARATAAVTGAKLGGALTALAPKPTINPRSQWNAAPANFSGNTPKGQPELAPRLVGAIIHHQAGTNNYSQAQVPGIIRSVQVWHMGNNGWDDIGYNFVVDKYGGIWEGRQGGTERNVVGAHATNFNKGSTGVCFLGSMDTAEPSVAALDAAGRLVAWRLGVAGLTSLRGNTVYSAAPGSPTKPVVAGHRDVNSTDCPGRHLYAKLDVIRSYSPVVPDVPPKTPFQQVVLSEDLDKDGRGELVVVDNVGDLFIIPMASSSKPGTPRKIGGGWTNLTLLAPGDWDRDGHVDLMSINSNGDLTLYANDGLARFRARQIGGGWGALEAHPTVDLDGDGNRDVLAVDRATGSAYLYLTNSRGQFLKGRIALEGNWEGWSLHPLGDMDGDKIGDVLGLAPDGGLYYHQGKAGGGLTGQTQVGAGWQPWQLIAGADLTGDRLSDIVALHKETRRVLMYPGRGPGQFNVPTTLAAAW
ncbi:MAG: N-acetylmuramoyl-L-alanine amidase [Bifidobacteriaceae bacterium]|jgi:hypothetical protein|nr:N-acetylmuramoyl-L-alanine amidase [Bifidobacteriaceae bacterium]